MKGRVLTPTLQAYDPTKPLKNLGSLLVLWGMDAYVRQ